MDEKNDKSIDFVSVPKKSFWRLTLPIMIFVLFNAIYAIVDLYWISKIDSHSFYAASVSIPIFTLICSMGDSIGQGTNSLMSRSMGANDYKNAYNTIVHGLIVCLVMWALMIVSIPYLDDLLYFADINKSVDIVVSYLSPILFYSIFFILPNFFSETLQSEGDSRRPTMAIILGNVINLLIDPILIFNFNLGIVGAAYATIISSLVSSVILIYLYLAKKTKVPISIRNSKIRPHIFLEIMNVAVPNFFKDSLFCTISVFINGILLREIGQIGVMLYSTSTKLQDIFITPIRAYGRGLMSVTGHLFGSKKIDGLNTMYHYVLRISLVTIIFISVLFVVFRDSIYYAFSISGMNLAIEHIAIIGTIILISVTIIMITSKMIDGFGKSYYNLLFTGMIIVLQIGIISVVDDVLHYGLSVLVGIMFSEAISAIIYYIFLRYMFKRFDKQKKEEQLVVK